MKKPLTALVVVMLQSGPALARDMVDETTHELTPYGVVISMIAGAQVGEMSCNRKGQISLAVAKAQRLGVPIDINGKEDYAAIVFRASQILTQARKEGVASCCKKSEGLEQFLKEP
jgi:hypothetical protein